MIISRTPFRVSFIGGGSDIKDFYKKNGYGSVVSAAIKKYMYIIIHPYFHDKIRLKYQKVEDVNEISEIKHPLIRECLKKVKVESGIEIASFADIPAGTGLGSSSSFTVGLLNALYAYKGRIVSKEQLAREACEIEIDILGEPIGKQDQYAAAYGNINYIRFNKDESVNVAPILLTEPTKRILENNLALYYIGGERMANSILEEQKRNISDEDKYNNIKKMVQLSDILMQRLNNQDYDSIGEIMHDGWNIKKSLSKNITNEYIDKKYNEFLNLGVKGGKLLGAGGAGFFLLYSDNHKELDKENVYKKIIFNIDMEGSKIIFYE